MRARTGTRVEETAKLVAEIEDSIRKLIPADELVGLLDNIGIPNSAIALSYSNNGLIGAGDSDILISLNEGHHHPTDGYVRQLRQRLNREFPGIMFYFLPADIVSQTLSFGIPAPLNVQITGWDRAKNRAIAA
jgi:multidrug efflux pump subunit AcrB